jgi:hypothetical protein
MKRGFWDRLPPPLRPLEEERRGAGNVRLVETTLLVLVGLVLAIATINDVARQTGVNHRLIEDLRTWRSYTGHDYKSVGIEQELAGAKIKHDIVCGNTTPGAPKARIQICLVMGGAIGSGKRKVLGGWYLPAETENDLREYRYGCFGAAATGLCAR